MRAMCGIAGIFEARALSAPEALGNAARRMADAMLHRGPDAGDVWCDAAAGLALGHRRLSIIDLTPTGAQPMVSSCGRFVISYNGEAYNFAALKAELEAAGRRFRGTCDTEVIVEAAAQWGVAATAQRLIGMFAMALWDRRDRVLYLLRDRLGIKPLYWGNFSGTMLFGSELKALRAHPGWTPALDRDAAADFFRLGYIPAPKSIYRGVMKLPPGTILTARAGAEPELKPFWSLDAVAREGQAARFAGSEDEAVAALDALLGDAVRRRLIADVPLGAFLSGGIDSSTVVALMQANTAKKVRSFTIGFHDGDYDEAPDAKAVAAHLGTDHTELYVAPEHAQSVIPLLPDMYDEPFADVSQIPTFLVSEMTRKHVTVALSGDGGDEVFGGYNRYLELQRVERALQFMPRGAGRIAAAAIRSVPLSAWPQIAQLLPEKRRPPQFGDKMQKLAAALASDARYESVVAQWPNAEAIVLGAAAKPDAGETEQAAGIADPVERMQYRDMACYLPDDILAKLDRASMAVSLEARVPLLDHRVVAFAWSLPGKWKARPGAGKYLLRRVLQRYVPAALTDRPKTGFAVPIDAWLRGPLRDWAQGLLDAARLKREGVLDAAPIRAVWQAHCDGARNAQHLLWIALMFEAWKERWLPG